MVFLIVTAHLTFLVARNLTVYSLVDKNTFFGIYRVPVIVSKPKTFYILFILAVGNNSVMTQHKKNFFYFKLL